MKKIGLLLGGLVVCVVGYAQVAEMEKINSKKVEYSPSLSAEGDYIVFQSDKDASDISEEAQWKIYGAHLQEDNTWGEPVEISNINNNVAFVAGPSLSYDGNTLYFTAFVEGETESEDIFYSKRKGDEWSTPINIGSPVNTPDLFEGFPSISSDENSIYFLRVNQDNSWNKKEKENCFTIFVAHKDSNGEWKEPTPLPEPINLGCESNPRIMADNKTLIFSSIREGGQGNFDLYQSTLIGENQWSEPISLDFINTKKKDVSPSIPASGDVVYYTAADDILKAVVPENYRQAVNITVNGNFTDENKKTGLKGTVEVIDVETEKVISTHNTNEATGRYSLVLQSGKKYDLRFVAKNYDPYIENYDLSGVKEYEERSLNVAVELFYKATLEIADAEIESSFPSTVRVLNKEGEQIKEIFASNNKAFVILPVGLTFDIITEAKNYHSDTLKIDLTKEPADFREIKKISLNPKKVPVSIALGNRGSDRNSRKIRVENERTGEVIEADADQVLLLRSGDRYKVIVNSEKGYAFASDEIDLTNYDEATEEQTEKVYASTDPDVVIEEKPVIALNIPVTQLKKGTEITLKHILFETNSAELATSSYGELDQLVDMLVSNPELVIEIAAHTDDVGSDAINLDLSQKRAQSVANYLVSKGITADKFQAKGYGESKPKVANSSAENRAINRRVEFIVLE